MEKQKEAFKPASRLKLVALGIIAYLALASISLTFMGGIEGPIIVGHFPAVIGLPMAAALAFIIVTLLPMSYGPIEFEAVGIKLKGASGPIVLWLICFIAISALIKLLW